MGFAIGMLAVGIGVIGYWHRQAAARRESTRRALPASFLGKVSLWLLLAGLLVGPLSSIEGPVAVSVFGGFAPLGLAAFACWPSSALPSTTTGAVYSSYRLSSERSLSSPLSRSPSRDVGPERHIRPAL